MRDEDYLCLFLRERQMIWRAEEEMEKSNIKGRGSF